ncbi:conserved hypothetical protein [Histoplasma capsulatum var. duboisii H88]|uniref:Uncharacterized protein n=1 Tax=Ajellomyces capsulatus (strain H88) TaxID=544711 RepID=F0UDP6_AJEC8|nr:conserved hypothetical protein [Histoplasma capsulatum var. duboisii H88]
MLGTVNFAVGIADFADMLHCGAESTQLQLGNESRGYLQRGCCLPASGANSHLKWKEDDFARTFCDSYCIQRPEATQNEQLKPRNLDKICSTYTTQYSSPILKDVDIMYESVQFNGSFTKASIYQQPPGPLVDKAWLTLGTRLESILVPEDEAEKYGIQQGQNLLRQTSYFNYEYYSKLGDGPFRDSEEMLKTHIGHCIDILRQRVMCTSDVGIMGQWWVEGVGPFSNFNTVHKCRNFEEIRKWTEKHQSSRENAKARKRPGDIVLPGIP